MPHGEQERRKAVLRIAATVDADDGPADAPQPDGTHGQVVEVSSGLCRVRIGGRTLLCGLRGSLSVAETGFTNVVAVGDRVIVSEDGQGGGVVEDVLPRRSAIIRADPFYTHLQQVLAANVDQLLIVAAWRSPHIWTELIDRYLIAAERSRVEPLICVNKVDLAGSPAEIEDVIAPYRALGVRILLTSATTGAGVDALREALRGKVTVLAGLSGVGKSSLLAAVEPGFALRTAEVNEERGQGRHTTTQSTMLPLGGGNVIDTPGIREFGLAGLAQRDLIGFYPDLEAHARGCRFSDCTHDHEPGCAVRTALRAGLLDAGRLENYRKIRETLPA